MVKQVVPRGSADRSGRVRVGDHILRVAGIDATSGMGVTDLRNLIVGEQGTRVSILFRLVSSSVSAWSIFPKSSPKKYMPGSAPTQETQTQTQTQVVRPGIEWGS